MLYFLRFSSLLLLCLSCSHQVAVKDVEPIIYQEAPPQSITQPQALLFDPPAGWYHAEKPDSPYVKLFIVGTGQKGYPPSINLCIEPFKGSLQEYLKIVQKINQEEGGIWKDLGSCQTPAGKGDLSQLDVMTPYGALRMLHFIMADGDNTYIFTATARRDEFFLYYKDFFTAIQSLRFGSLPTQDP